MLARIRNTTLLERTVAAIGIEDSEKPTWAAISADFIEEWKKRKISDSANTSFKQRTSCVGGEGIHKSNKYFKDQNSATPSCSYSARYGNDDDECFLNPEPPSFKAPSQARDFLRVINPGKIRKRPQLTFHQSLN